MALFSSKSERFDIPLYFIMLDRKRRLKYMVSIYYMPVDSVGYPWALSVASCSLRDTQRIRVIAFVIFSPSICKSFTVLHCYEIKTVLWSERLQNMIVCTHKSNTLIFFLYVIFSKNRITS